MSPRGTRCCVDSDDDRAGTAVREVRGSADEAEAGGDLRRERLWVLGAPESARHAGLAPITDTTASRRGRARQPVEHQHVQDPVLGDRRAGSVQESSFSPIQARGPAGQRWRSRRCPARRSGRSPVEPSAPPTSVQSARRPSPLRGLAAPATAGQGRYDAMESGIGQQRQHVEEFHDAARPAVGEDERERIAMRRLSMQEMDRETVDRRGELRHGVQVPLGDPPAVVLRAARAASLQPFEPNALTGSVGGSGEGGARSRARRSRARLAQRPVRAARSSPRYWRAHHPASRPARRL